MLSGAKPVAIDDTDSDSDEESSSTDDIDLLRRLQERFYVPSSDADSLPFIKPLSSRPPPDSDEEDDFETLWAIQKRFTQYESDAVGRNFQNSIQDPEIVVTDMTSEPDTHNILPQNGKSMVPSEELLASGFTEHAEDGARNVNIGGFMKSRFPKSAKFFVDALKKNRSCQKFIRRKLIEIEAKIETNKELKECLKCLMDFQVACKRKAAHILSQKKDPRVRLISMRKPGSITDSKVNILTFMLLTLTPLLLC
ncbi:putative myb-like protein L [Cocos nucifera]|uniref:Putative myb-like protein L n=1 Tax=Cocos nucifera TaxID=13894 RepID=A0A8K0IVN1_COCNU|nr:putative myb-like protein L [Cocos nucifera]